MSSKPLHDHMDLYNELYRLLGSKIKFKTSDGEYEGILKLVLPRSQRVTFEHVYYVPTREYMGNLNFFFREFLAYEVVETADKLQKYEKWAYLTQILDRNYVGTNYRVDDLFNGELDDHHEPDENIPYSDEMFDDDFVLRLPENLKNKLPHDSIILESPNSEFHQALRYISEQSVIGVSFEGPKISRLGKLSWICISTPYCVFLFDIELLGKAAFDEGLRSIFQNKRIQKVIHDCRQASDCLSHLFKTELVNVFDTQVADYIVNMQRYSDKPTFKYVSSLDCCLVNHLDVPQEFLYNRKKNLSYDNEILFFRIRPISNDYRNVVIKNALYLLLLKESLAESMMSPFTKAVDVYLKVLANASEPELLLEPSVPDKIPPALVMQGIQTVRFQEIPTEETPIPLVFKFKNLQNDKLVEFPQSLNIESENQSISANTDLNMDKTDNIINKNVTKKSKLNSLQKLKSLKSNKNVVVEQMCAQNSMKHIDNVYHRLVNNLHGSDVSKSVDIKPSEEYVSNFAVKRSYRSNTLEESSFSSDSSVQSDSESSFDLKSENSANTSTDSSDKWSSLRSAFGASEKSNDKAKKIIFFPAGMPC